MLWNTLGLLLIVLVAKFRVAKGDGEDVEIRAQISRAVDSSPTLRNTKDLIENFVDSVSASGEIDAEWRAHVDSRREAELDQIIEEEKLKPEETVAFVEAAFRDGVIRTSGTAITKVMPPTTRFFADGGHGQMKLRVLVKLITFFERFLGLVSNKAFYGEE
jgi:type I restriction enzyme R subunit